MRQHSLNDVRSGTWVEKVSYEVRGGQSGRRLNEGILPLAHRPSKNLCISPSKLQTASVIRTKVITVVVISPPLPLYLRATLGAGKVPAKGP